MVAYSYEASFKKTVNRGGHGENKSKIRLFEYTRREIYNWNSTHPCGSHLSLSPFLRVLRGSRTLLQDLNNRVYWVSCRLLAIANAGEKLLSASSGLGGPFLPIPGTSPTHPPRLP